jgi:hypothetical protein
MSAEEMGPSSFYGRRRGASTGEGWGIRIRDIDGRSWMMTYSMGDVMVYDDRADAERDVADMIGRNPVIGPSSTYTIERVARGAWQPNPNERLFLAALPYVEQVADNGDRRARAIANHIRSNLSPYAPDELRRAR